MGALSRFGVSKGSKLMFDQTMGPANQVMNFVRDHPVLTKVASIAFPPARGVIMAAEMGDTLRSVLNKTDREGATKAFKKANERGGSLLERITAMDRNVDQQARRQRDNGAR